MITSLSAPGIGVEILVHVCWYMGGICISKTIFSTCTGVGMIVLW